MPLLSTSRISGGSPVPEAPQLAPLFSEGAVFQQGKPLVIWGQADPGEEIEVAFAGQSRKAVADAHRRWSVTLHALEMNTQPQTLFVRTVRVGNQTEVKNILVGDVWLCSGQSNMARVVEDVPDAAEFPLIRGWVSPKAPAVQPAFSNGGWWSADPFSTGEGVDGWSAVAYHFAREVHRETGTPIGLIMTAYGGTEIEAWLSEEAAADSGAGARVQARWQSRLAQLPAATREWEQDTANWQKESAEAARTGVPFHRKPPRPPEGIGSRKQPGALYNGMVVPFVPYGLRGILWYQGESNVGRHEDYRKLFPALISSWRAAFGQGDLPFYFVQLPNYEPKPESVVQKWPYLREAQTAALDLPHTGMAVTIDIGDANDLHPKNKRDVGRRLARLALKNEYGKALATAGPEFVSARTEGAAMRVKFRGDSHWEIREGDGPGFEVAGADGRFVPAIARKDGADLLVSLPEIPEPTAVRYAWRNNPTVLLFGVEGLPAAPFRSDNWSMPDDPPPDTAARPRL